MRWRLGHNEVNRGTLQVDRTTCLVDHDGFRLGFEGIAPMADVHLVTVSLDQAVAVRAYD